MYGRFNLLLIFIQLTSMPFITKLTILACFLLSLLLSCCKKEDSASRLIKAWREKKIRFPENIIFTRYATDTVEYALPANRYKILVYVDSTGCTSCKLQLFRWKDFADCLDTVASKSVPVLFFFQSGNIREIHFLLKRHGFDYPVCVDREDRLNRLNRFPRSAFFQAFLLNEKNQVVLIGNPINNSALKKLYIRQILANDTIR